MFFYVYMSMFCINILYMLYNDVANAKYFFLCFHSNYYANRKSNGNINIKFIDNIRKDTASLQEYDLKGITKNINDSFTPRHKD
jgi:hypothetical protein